MIPEILNFNGIVYRLVKPYNDANKASKELLYPIDSSICFYHVKDINQFAVVAHAVGKMPEDSPETLPRLFALVGFSKNEIKTFSSQMLPSMNIYAMDFNTTSLSIVASLVKGAREMRESVEEITGDPLANAEQSE